MSAEPDRPGWIVRLFNPWVTIPFGLLLVAVSAPFVYRASRLNGVPRIEVFDVEAFLDFEVDENAGCWPEYRRAVGMLVDSGPYVARVSDSFYDGYDGWEQAGPVFREYVRDNRPALEAWRAATEAEFAPRIHPRRRKYLDPAPSVHDTREFVRLAILFAERAIRDGDTVEAWTWYAASLRASRHLIQRGALIERLVSCALVAIVSDAIAEWASHDTVTAEQLEDARRLLREITAATPPLEECVKVEYVLLRNSLHEAPRAERAKLLDDLDGLTRLSWIENEFELGIRLVDHQYAHALEAGRLDWVALQGRIGKHGYLQAPTYVDAMPGEELFERAIGSRFTKAVGYGVSSQAAEAVHREASRLRALDVVLAAEVHRREYGAYPASAADLVPGILADVPDDPFAKPGDLLRYTVRDGRPNAWSVGPNGADDDGRFWSLDGKDDFGVPFGDPDDPVAEPEDPGTGAGE